MIKQKVKDSMKYATTKCRDIDIYCKNNRDDIRRMNMRTLRLLSITASVIIFAFILMTPYLIPGWVITIHYKVFLAVTILFAIFALAFHGKSLNKQNKMIYERLLCLLFLLMLMTFMIILDTVPYPNSQQSFVAIFLVAAPILFIVPIWEMLVLQFYFLGGFIFMAVLYKNEMTARGDVFNVLFGFVVSLIIYMLVMNLRVHDYRQKVIYKKSSELDALTGIANRAACKRRIDEYLKNRQLQDTCAMIVLDVDNFKQVNDKMGHSTGDKVLKNVANILEQIFGETNIVGRFGGDEFLVFVTSIVDEKDVHKKCIQINDEMKRILNGNFDFSCSMGVCFLKNDVATQEELFRAADNALYEAKAFRKGTHVQHIFERSIVSKEEMPLMVIIDDNQVDLEILGIQFEESFRIQKIASSRKALEYIEHNNAEISIILMDMVMPEINGYEMLKKLKSKPSTGWIPVVAVSADEEVEETALSLGAEDMILKPIVPAIVKLRIANVMKKVRV